jgi:hypothetical protein
LYISLHIATKHHPPCSTHNYRHIHFRNLTTTPSEHTSYNMSTHTYKFNIGMSCGGCSGAVERVLKKLDG